MTVIVLEHQQLGSRQIADIVHRVEQLRRLRRQSLYRRRRLPGLQRHGASHWTMPGDRHRRQHINVAGAGAVVGLLSAAALVLFAAIGRQQPQLAAAVATLGAAQLASILVLWGAFRFYSEE